ncbi:hypothetical protein [Telluribacter humicola]|uniref:hypothetical protein n=1 Tax=Telluribacter humicola TaxID=1720261 RepID=UPI001A9676EE|nr:hypothetical protein [Telluribacter humicola]
MNRKLLKRVTLGFLLFFTLAFLWYKFETSHIQYVPVKDCDKASAQSLKALSGMVEDSWFQRKHYDVVAHTSGLCMFYMYYQEYNALYFGEEMSSGNIIGVAMTPDELHEFADTISTNTDFQKMLDYLEDIEKAKPAPVHEF